MDVLQCWQEMRDRSTADFNSQLEKSLETLVTAFTMYKPEEIALSFNGGKDCTVALHLMRAALRSIEARSGGAEQSQDLLRRVKFVHFVKSGEFEQIEEFRSQIEQRYGFQVQLFSSDFKREVGRLIDEQGVKAVIMGNRRTDPWSQNLQPFTESSEGWPRFMRVFPILDWDYCEIWKFLRDFDLPYCSLYDQGYTSLGEKHNSQPNPSLKVEGANGEYHYRPAYTLQDGALERMSRL